MMDINIRGDKKEYFKCSMYYMRRYFGLREIILMSILLVAGLLLYFLADGLFLILVLFGVTVVVLLVCVILFVWTSVAGYKHDLEKVGIFEQKLHFEEEGFTADYFDKGGAEIMSEHFEYEQIEGVVIRKNFIYIYAAMAIFYYIKRDKSGDAEFADLGVFLRSHVPEQKFKFKVTKRRYPKKKKITIDGGDGKQS